MYASNVEGFDSLRHTVENPRGAQIIALDATAHFDASRGELYTTAQPVRGFTFGGLTA